MNRTLVFVLLHFPPGVLELVEAGLGQLAPRVGEARLDGLEAARELGSGVPQRGLGIGVQVARQVGQGE